MASLAGNVANVAQTAAQTVVGALPDALTGSAAEKLHARIPDNWLRWEELETPVEDEDRKIDELCAVVRDVVQRNFNAHGHGFRATHVKTTGIVKGELRVHHDIPEYLRHGVFAYPGRTYPVIARYANEPSYIWDDREPQPRGLGLKVFGVEGSRLPGYEEGNTQDFHFNNAPMLELADLDTALEIFKIRAAHFDDRAGYKKAVATRADAPKQLARFGVPHTHPAAQELFTQGALAHGPYAAHLPLVPASTAQLEAGAGPSPNSTDDAQVDRTLLRAFFGERGAVYTLRAQFASSRALHPVEDASVVWAPAVAPWLPLATVVFPAQESWSDARRVWWEDSARG